MLPQNTNIEILLRCQFSKVVFWSSPGGLKSCVLEAQTLSFWFSWAISKIDFLEGPMFAKIALLITP